MKENMESIAVIDLDWIRVESQFSISFIANVREFGASFCIWLDQETGKTISSNPLRQRKEHDSIVSAKLFCQQEFKEMVIKMLYHDERKAIHQ